MKAASRDMALPSDAIRQQDSRRRGRHSFVNGEIHHWYRLVLGYTDQPVAFLLDRLGVRKSHKILDPFCGAGTTLVECLKRNISWRGVDANPSSCFAARVKTRWGISPEILVGHLDELERLTDKHLCDRAVLRTDPTYSYLESSGMIDRGWIGKRSLEAAIALKLAIKELRTTNHYREAFILALVTEVVHCALNVKFGPELYCGPAKDEQEVFAAFSQRVALMSDDLKLTRSKTAVADVFQGDARDLSSAIHGRQIRRSNFFAALSGGT